MRNKNLPNRTRLWTILRLEKRIRSHLTNILGIQIACEKSTASLSRLAGEQEGLDHLDHFGGREAGVFEETRGIVGGTLEELS